MPILVVGLTGGIAAGKSTVAKMFKELGAYVIDYDALSREAVQPGTPAWQEIVTYFGEEILKKDGTLDREKLGRLVFHDPEKLRTLNGIIHPEVFREGEKQATEIFRKDPAALIIKDIPLLVETGAQKLVEVVIVVYARPEVQLQRLKERGLSLEDAKARLNAQAPPEERLKYADFIIYNNGSLEETKKQVAQIYRILKKKGKSRPVV
ncbi:MAG: dephospho-CoA kinase [Desulfotomaculales bacterium]